MQASSSKYCVRGLNILKVDKSLPYVLTPDYAAIVAPLTEADFKSGCPSRQKAEEFKKLAKLTFTDDHQASLYLTKSSKAHNRYSDILPFEHNMVRLLPGLTPELSEPYINANSIANPYTGASEVFIATQAPLPTGITQFWRMIYQKKAESIVMLCGLLEHGRVSCDVYWPDPQNGTPEKFACGELEVSLVRVEKMNEFFWVRTIKIKNTAKNDELIVRQYHTVGWPDRKIPLPNHYKYVLQMIQLMQQNHASHPAPTVVHCSAGIGRTGTLIALYFLVSLAEQQKSQGQPVSLSVFGTVRSLREQRFGAVQTSEQYEFIYEFMRLYFNKQLN